MPNLTTNIQTALNQYPTERSIKRFRSKESMAAVTYLQLLITQNANDITLRNIIFYLLRRGARPANTPSQIHPLKMGGRLYNLLNGALGQPITGAKDHLIVLLNNWDWIQLTNVHKYVAKHGQARTEVTTLQNLATALGNLGNNSKIHIVGHGDKNSFAGNAGITPSNIAVAINNSLPLNTRIKIRVDTCSSAVLLHGNTTAGTIKNRLVALGRNANDIEVSGTTGASVTGITGKRIVVDPAHINTAVTIQNVLMYVHHNDIQSADALCGSLNANSTSDEIKQIVRQAWGYSQYFFNDFEELLNNWRNHGGTYDIALTHLGGGHKTTY